MQTATTSEAHASLRSRGARRIKLLDLPPSCLDKVADIWVAKYLNVGDVRLACRELRSRVDQAVKKMSVHVLQCEDVDVCRTLALFPALNEFMVCGVGHPTLPQLCNLVLGPFWPGATVTSLSFVSEEEGYFASDGAVSSLLRHRPDALPNVVRLELENFSKTLPSSMLNLAQLTRLTQLELSNSSTMFKNVLPHNLSALSALTALQDLALRGAQCNSAPLLTGLPALTSVTKLALHLRPVTRGQILGAAAMPNLAELTWACHDTTTPPELVNETKHPEYVEEDDGPEDDDDNGISVLDLSQLRAAAAAASAFPKLRRLSVDALFGDIAIGSERVDSAVMEVLSAAKGLTELDLAMNGSRRMSQAALEAVACPQQLQRLTLSEHYSFSSADGDDFSCITNELLLSLAQRLTALVELELTASSHVSVLSTAQPPFQLTDAAFVGTSQLPRLRRLTLVNYQLVNVGRLCTLCVGLYPQLQELRVVRCGARADVPRSHPTQAAVIQQASAQGASRVPTPLRIKVMP